MLDLPTLSIPHMNSSSSSINMTSDVSALKDFYAAVSKVEERDLKQQIHSAMENILYPWTHRQDDLIRSLNQLEQSYLILLQDSQTKTALYNKTLHEMKYYKAKYEALAFHTNTTHTKTSSFSRRSYASTDSKGSSIYQPSFCSHRPDSPISPSMAGPTDLLSHVQSIPAAKPPPSDSLPLPPLPLIKPMDRENSLVSIEVSNIQIPMHESASEELEFACCDGFWSMIALEKTKEDKEQVDLLVKNYLKKGGKPNVANHSGTIKLVKEGYGLIHALIVARNTLALQRVIEAGANPHALPLSKEKISPLVLAAQMGYMNGIRLLIERARVNVLSSKGPHQETALLAAIHADDYDVVLYLVRFSSKLLDMADDHGATPLHYACASGNTKIMNLLVRDYGQMTDVVDYKGETPLHYAIRNKRFRAVTELVGVLGAYPNPYVPKKVPTPLDLAKQGGLCSIAEYLGKMGAKTVKEMAKKASMMKLTPAISTVSLDSSSMHSSRTSMSHESSTSQEFGNKMDAGTM